MNDIIEAAVGLIENELEQRNSRIWVAYDESREELTFLGNYIYITVDVYSRYDTFNFGEIIFEPSEKLDHLYPEDTNDTMSEIQEIFSIINDFNGVTIQM